MKEDPKYSYTGKTGSSLKKSKSNDEALRIGVTDNRPHWIISDDVVDEMLAELREQENAAHE